MMLKSWCDWFTDEQIEQAPRPPGYDPDWRKWPEGSYKLHEVHMYHCRQLIEAMRAAKGWVGPPLRVLVNGTIDGNHRLRGVRYLQARGLDITIPVKLERTPA